MDGILGGLKAGMRVYAIAPLSRNPPLFRAFPKCCSFSRTRSRPYFYNGIMCSSCGARNSVSHQTNVASKPTMDGITKPPLSQGVILYGTGGENHRVSWKQLSADDIVSGAVDVLGWTVQFEIKGGAMGKVCEIVHVDKARSLLEHADTSLTWLKVVESLAACGDELGDQMETHVLEGTLASGMHAVILKQSRKSSPESMPLATEILVPVVDEIVKGVDIESRTLVIFPPKGLLELARRPDVIRRLRPSILQFCKKHPPEFVRKRAVHTRIKNSGFMPTQKQLQQAGMQGLIKEINAAGGILSVAQALNLHANRRPNGYWENLMRLDIEIECFIWESWMEKFDDCTEMSYYWNTVTNEVSEKKPPFPNISDFVKSQEAVMPRQSTVMEAKRWDLNHAIIFHGGYKAVGNALQRWTVYVRGRKPRRHVLPKQKSADDSSSKQHYSYVHLRDVKGFKSKTLLSEQSSFMTFSQLKLSINKYMKTRGISQFPTYKDLQGYDQKLFASVKRHGGRLKVAKAMNIKLRRHKRGYWSCLSVAGAALRSYMCSKIAEEMSLKLGYDEELLWREATKDGCLKLPTHTQVLNDGRPDLHYVLQRFGRHQLAQHLMIPQRVMLQINDDM